MVNKRKVFLICAILLAFIMIFTINISLFMLSVIISYSGDVDKLSIKYLKYQVLGFFLLSCKYIISVLIYKETKKCDNKRNKIFIRIGLVTFILGSTLLNVYTSQLIFMDYKDISITNWKAWVAYLLYALGSFSIYAALHFFLSQIKKMIKHNDNMVNEGIMIFPKKHHNRTRVNINPPHQFNNREFKRKNKRFCRPTHRLGSVIEIPPSKEVAYENQHPFIREQVKATPNSGNVQMYTTIHIKKKSSEEVTSNSSALETH